MIGRVKVALLSYNILLRISKYFSFTITPKRSTGILYQTTVFYPFLSPCFHGYKKASPVWLEEGPACIIYQLQG